MTLWIFEDDLHLMNWLLICLMVIEWVTLSMTTFIDLDGLQMNPWIVKALFLLGVLSMVPLDNLLCFNYVVFILPYCFDSFMLVPINCLQVLHDRAWRHGEWEVAWWQRGIWGALPRPCLRSRRHKKLQVASRGAYLSESKWVQQPSLCVLDEPLWVLVKSWSWLMNERSSNWDEGVACNLWHLFTFKHALFRFNTLEIGFFKWIVTVGWC